jgi:iron complex outermembrane receptor protein
LSTTEPLQTQSQDTWSVAAENTFHLSAAFDVIAGVSYDKYQIARAEEFTVARGLFEYPRGGSDAVNWQAAGVWHYSQSGQLHERVRSGPLPGDLRAL